MWSITSVRLIFALGVIVSALCSSPLWAQAPAWWTAVGSTGVTTELNQVFFSSTGSVRLAAAPGKVRLRYSIATLPGVVLSRPEALSFSARFRDNGAGAQLLVMIQRAYLDRDGAETILILDSDSYAQTNEFQTVQKRFCRPSGSEPTGAYFVEVHLLRRRPSFNAELATLAIRADEVLC